MRQLFDSLLGEGAGDNGIRPARQVARHVFEGLAFRNQPDLRDKIPAELLDCELESHARPQRWLFEKKRNITALQRRRVALPRLLHLASEIKHAVEVLRREIQVVAKVDHPRMGCWL